MLNVFKCKPSSLPKDISRVLGQILTFLDMLCLTRAKWYFQLLSFWQVYLHAKDQIHPLLSYGDIADKKIIWLHWLWMWQKQRKHNLNLFGIYSTLQNSLRSLRVRHARSNPTRPDQKWELKFVPFLNISIYASDHTDIITWK